MLGIFGIGEPDLVTGDGCWRRQKVSPGEDGGVLGRISRQVDKSLALSVDHLGLAGVDGPAQVRVWG